MLFIQPEPKQAARGIEAYTVNITVKDVDTVLIDRLSTRIEQYLRGAAALNNSS